MRPALALLALAPLRHTMLNGRIMIIACPACTTRYVVPDSAIGVDGRTVRCAKCKHNWFQEGPQIDPPPAPVPAPAPMDRAPPPQARPAPAQPAAAPAAEAPAAAPVDEEVPVPPVYTEPAYHGSYADDDETSQFYHQPLLAPRRNPARMWTLAAALFATVAIAAIGATAWYGLPDWMPFAGLRRGPGGSEA